LLQDEVSGMFWTSQTNFIRSIFQCYRNKGYPYAT
jgi:hypothetical protein